VEAESLAARAAVATPSERARLTAQRRKLLEGLVEIYGARPHASLAVAEARRLLAAAEANAD
jgi:hypothetical protein